MSIINYFAHTPHVYHFRIVQSELLHMIHAYLVFNYINIKIICYCLERLYNYLFIYD